MAQRPDEKEKASGSKFPVLRTLCQSLKLTEKSLHTTLKKVVTVKAEDSLLEAFRMLVENNILSAPVRDGEKWIGFLDVRDLASYVSHLYDSHKQQPTTLRQRRSSGSKDKIPSPEEPVIAKELEDTVEKQVFEKKRSHLDRIIDIAALESSINVRYFSRRNLFKPLPASATLWDVRVNSVPVPLTHLIFIGNGIVSEESEADSCRK